MPSGPVAAARSANSARRPGRRRHPRSRTAMTTGEVAIGLVSRPAVIAESVASSAGRAASDSGTHIAGGVPAACCQPSASAAAPGLGQRGDGRGDAGRTGDRSGGVERGSRGGDGRGCAGRGDHRQHHLRRAGALRLVVATDDQHVRRAAPTTSTTATTVTMIQVAMPRRPPLDAWRDVIKPPDRDPEPRAWSTGDVGVRSRHCNQRSPGTGPIGWSQRGRAVTGLHRSPRQGHPVVAARPSVREMPEFLPHWDPWGGSWLDHLQRWDHRDCARGCRSVHEGERTSPWRIRLPRPGST